MAATSPRCRALGRYPPEGKTVIDPQLMPLARAWRFSCCIKRSPAIDQVASWLSFIFRTLRIPRKHSSNDELIGDLQRSLNIIPGGHLTSFGTVRCGRQSCGGQHALTHFGVIAGNGNSRPTVRHLSEHAISVAGRS